jgi:hypothetical protein
MITGINEYKVYESAKNQVLINATELYSIFLSQLDNIRKEIDLESQTMKSTHDYDFEFNVNSTKYNKVTIKHFFNDIVLNDITKEYEYIVTVIVEHDNNITESLEITLVYEVEQVSTENLGYYEGPEYIETDVTKDVYELIDVFVRKYDNNYEYSVYHVTGDFLEEDKYKNMSMRNNEVWEVLGTEFDKKIDETSKLVYDSLISSNIILD